MYLLENILISEFLSYNLLLTVLYISLSAVICDNLKCNIMTDKLGW